MELRYRAIVLKKREVGETDRIYTFFTREAGKVSSIAKGVRKSEAKLAAALETGSIVDIIVVRTRGMGKVAGALLEESFAGIRGSFDALRLTLEVLTTFDRLVEPEERDEKLYGSLERYLHLMDRLGREKNNDKLVLITEAFLFQLCFALGYTLQLGQCVVSGQKLVPGERYILSPSHGGVVRQASAREVQDGVRVSEETVKCLRLFVQHSLDQVARVAVTAGTLQELTRFRRIFLEWVRH